VVTLDHRGEVRPGHQVQTAGACHNM